MYWLPLVRPLNSVTRCTSTRAPKDQSSLWRSHQVGTLMSGVVWRGRQIFRSRLISILHVTKAAQRMKLVEYTPIYLIYLLLIHHLLQYQLPCILLQGDLEPMEMAMFPLHTHVWKTRMTPWRSTREEQARQLVTRNPSDLQTGMITKMQT